jgi:anti-sigma factor RsiW
MSAPRRIGDAELHAFLDGELAGAERAEVEALLAAGAPEQQLLRDFHDINEALRARYAGRLEEPIPLAMHNLVGRVRPWPAMLATRQAAVVAGLVIALAAGAAGYATRSMVGDAGRREPAFVANAIGAHSVYVPEVRHPVEVRAAEEHLVRWLTRRVGAPVIAPALNDLGWRLMGGRLVPDRGMPAAQFMYEDGTGRRLTLYIRKETGLGNTAFRFAERDGLGAFYWIDRPLAYALAGHLDREQLMVIANAVYAQLETLGAARSSGDLGKAR